MDPKGLMLNGAIGEYINVFSDHFVFIRFFGPGAHQLLAVWI